MAIENQERYAQWYKLVEDQEIRITTYHARLGTWLLARLYQGGYFKPQAPHELSRRNHPRTLRKSREQVKSMVIDGFLPKRIKDYLDRWLLCWVKTSEIWRY